MHQDINSGADTPFMTIELDLYSGRPNPEWTPTPDEADHILHLLDRSVVQPQGKMPDDRLGFRGFVVKIKTTDGVRRYNIHDGLIRSERQTFSDGGKVIETTISNTMPVALKRLIENFPPR